MATRSDDRGFSLADHFDDVDEGGGAIGAGSDSGGIWEGVRRRVGATLLGALSRSYFFSTFVRLALVFSGETLSFVCILVHGLQVQGL